MGTNNKNGCICKNCELLFDRADAALVTRKIYGIDIEERKCPSCGWDFRMISIPKYLDTYLDINKDPRYYTYNRMIGY